MKIFSFIISLVAIVSINTVHSMENSPCLTYNTSLCTQGYDIMRTCLNESLIIYRLEEEIRCLIKEIKLLQPLQKPQLKLAPIPKKSVSTLNSQVEIQKRIILLRNNQIKQHRYPSQQQLEALKNELITLKILLNI